MKHSRVLLINPVGFGDPSGRGVNIGLGYLASSLLARGHAVRVLDLNVPSDTQKRLDAALQWKPDLTGITCTTFSVKNAVNTIRYCKRRHESFYVAGGVHVTMEQEHFMHQHKRLFNCAVIGEADHTILELLDAVNGDRDLATVNGIIYHNERELVRTADRPLIHDLDALPFPNYHVFDTVDTLPVYPIITERGCPYNCVFCLSAYIWKRKWRPRSPENVIEEISAATKEYGATTLSIWDDNFTLPSPAAKARAKRICDLIIAEDLGLNITLPNGVRADSVDRELLVKLKRAGCTFMMMGVEDAAPETFSCVRKGESLDTIRRAVAMVKDVGIRVEASMVIGLIDATYPSTVESLHFLQQLGVKGHWVIAVPFRHTELGEWVRANGRNLADVSAGVDQCMTMYPPPVVFDTPEFTKAERLDAFALANLTSGNYSFLYNDKDSWVSKLGRVVSVAWKHDKAGMPRHLAFLVAHAVCHELRTMRQHVRRMQR